jgi:spermidine synthase
MTTWQAASTSAGGAVRILAAAFFLSGASALTYEIIWQRQMFLIFGASAPATTAILTAIFLGIAFGSQLAVPLLRRSSNPLTLYIALEAVMGAWGLLVPTLLRQADAIYLRGVASLGEGHTLQTPLRFCLAVVPLLPATLAMGATIPVMVRCVTPLRQSAVAWAYGVNILGSVVGSLLTGLLWLQMLGISQSRLIAVAANTLAVMIVAWLRRQSSRENAVESIPVESPVAVPDARTTAAIDPPRGLTLLYLFAGFVALGLEVVWLRFLGIVNSNSTATFTLTLTIYLLGMGLGSLLIYRRLKRRLHARTIFTVANLGVAVCSLGTFGVLYRAAYINVALISEPSRAGTLQLSDIYLAEALIIAGLMFLPTLFMGLVYPAVCDCFEGSGALRDRWIGRMYFVGTLGSVIGILLVGTVLIPGLGLHGTFSLLVCMSFGIAFVSHLRGERA